MGVDEIKTTYNHKFYVREKYRKGQKQVRCFTEPMWKELNQLTKNDYLGIAINQENKIINDKVLPTQSNDFWWLIGRYLGDGWLRGDNGIIICCSKEENNEIIKRLDSVGFHYCLSQERTVNKFHICKKSLYDFCKQFGRGAKNKHLTQNILDLPPDLLKSFIHGYLSADGCSIGKYFKATSVSKELIYGVAQCVAKAYHTPYRIYKITPPDKKVIEGRLVNQSIWYQLVFKIEKEKQDKAFYDNGYIWYPINSITYSGQENVYDIEVEQSHSFTVQNTIVHNCQDLSNAGKKAGMAKGESTRSGLLWEVERILLERKQDNLPLPTILLMENVPDICNDRNIEHFREWQLALEKLGYSNYISLLNATNFGIPQNRNRCFMVSILGNFSYEFPDKMPLNIVLKDIVDKNVDKKYYLSDEQLKTIVNWNAYQKPLETLESVERSGISPTITTRSGAYAAGMILVRDEPPKENKKVLKIGNYSPSGHNAASVIDSNGVAPTVMENHGTVTAFNAEQGIRKLTPKEEFKLMGVKPSDYECIQKNQSESSLYHLAGDSIVVSVLMAIFGSLLNINYKQKINDLIKNLKGEN